MIPPELSVALIILFYFLFIFILILLAWREEKRYRNIDVVFSEICKYLSMEKRPLFIVILGRIGRGRTHLAKRIYERCFSDHCFFELRAGDIDRLRNIATEQCNKYYLLFDDLTPQIGGGIADRRRIYRLSRVHHILKTNDVVVVVVGYYARSLLPIIKSASVKFLTSISWSEVRLYTRAHLCSKRSLKEYLWSYRVDRYKILACFSSEERVYDVTEEQPQRRDQIEETADLRSQ